MRRMICAVALILGIAVFALPAHTQEAAKKDVAIKPASESVAGSARSVERYRKEADCDGGGLPRGQVRVQAHAGAKRVSQRSCCMPRA